MSQTLVNQILVTSLENAVRALQEIAALSHTVAKPFGEPAEMALWHISEMARATLARLTGTRETVNESADK